MTSVGYLDNVSEACERHLRFDLVFTGDFLAGTATES
jgi:hypothetical protein